MKFGLSLLLAIAAVNAVALPQDSGDDDSSDAVDAPVAAATSAAAATSTLLAAAAATSVATDAGDTTADAGDTTADAGDATADAGDAAPDASRDSGDSAPDVASDGGDAAPAATRDGDDTTPDAGADTGDTTAGAEDPAAEAGSAPTSAGRTIPSIDTTSGTISGTEARWRSGVNVYYSVPFAKAPVGDLRFASPVKFPKSEKPLDGTKPSPNCWQFPASMHTYDKEALKKASPNWQRAIPFLFNLAGAYPVEQSEDCLYLNVWNKPGGSKNKAVLLWIYGGAFTFGSAQGGVYDGSVLADENDIIVVSPNYRVDTFGFANGPGIDSNVGLRDQRMAVEWVRDNIEKFGGDPKRITLMGQSAGGASVDMYAYAYKDDPIVAGIIPMSGTAQIAAQLSAPFPHKGKNEAGYFAFTQAVGCGTKADGAEKTLACLRAMPAYDFFKAAYAPHIVNNKPMIDTLGLEPYVDEETFFSDYPKRAAAGDFAKVPILVGNTEHEFPVELYLLRLYKPSKELGKDGFAPGNLVSLIGMTCGSSTAALDRMKQDVPAWMYSYAGNFSSTRWPVLGGNYHLSDVPYVFGTAPYTTETPATPEEAAYSKYIRGAWSAFVKDPVKGLSKAPYEWPKLSTKTDSVIRLAADNAVKPVMIESKYATALCSFFGCAQSAPTKLKQEALAKLAPKKSSSRVYAREMALAEEAAAFDPLALITKFIPPALKPVLDAGMVYQKGITEFAVQLNAFREVKPGKKAKAQDLFKSCESTFPSGPVPLPAG